MDSPAVMIQPDELNRRTLRIWRWLYAAMAVLAVYGIFTPSSGGDLSADFSFFADVFTVLAWVFFFYAPSQGHFSHYLRIDETLFFFAVA